jgi:ribosomal protein L22
MPMLSLSDKGESREAPMTSESQRARWMQRRAREISQLIAQAQSAGVRLKSLDAPKLYLTVERARELGAPYLARIAFLNGWRLEK